MHSLWTLLGDVGKGFAFQRCHLKRGGDKNSFLKKTFPFFSIHSYCDFLTEYLNFTSPGEVGTVFSFICFRVTNISALQGGARDKPSWGCA